MNFKSAKMPLNGKDIGIEISEKLKQSFLKNEEGLHGSKSREAIEELLKNDDCDINGLNEDGRAPLHMMVIKSRLDCVIRLLSRGANVSMRDKDGNTPLHLSVKQTNISIVQALVIFGADLDARNDEGNTARHIVSTMTVNKLLSFVRSHTGSNSNNIHDKILYVLDAVGAKRCDPEASEHCSPGCSASGEHNGLGSPIDKGGITWDFVDQLLFEAGKEKHKLDTEEQQGRLLCLDGGGIKGLVLVQILLNIEKAVGKPIIDCFDWVAGTSTGGILALALASGKTLRECQGLYFRLKDDVFVGMRPYPSEPLENILQECMGADTVMTDIKRPNLMILAVLADRKPVKLHMFRNYESAEDILKTHNENANLTAESDIDAEGQESEKEEREVTSQRPPDEQLVWQAARASGAAPVYFQAFGSYLDGGLIGNNPTMDALTELTVLKAALQATGRYDDAKRTQLKVVVSCGTGIAPDEKLKTIEVFKLENLFDTPRLAAGFSSIIMLLIDQATESDGRKVERDRAWCSAMGVPYHRFSPRLSLDVKLNESSDEKLVTMLWETQVYMNKQTERLAELAALLKDTATC